MLQLLQRLLYLSFLILFIVIIRLYYTIFLLVYAQKVGNWAPKVRNTRRSGGGGACPHPFSFKMSPFFLNKFLINTKNEMTHILIICCLITTYFSKQMAGLSASWAVIQTLYQTKRLMLVHNIFNTTTTHSVLTLPENEIPPPLFRKI